MKIVIIADLPDKDMNPDWVKRKAEELESVVDSYLRRDFVQHGHDEQNTTLHVEVKVRADRSTGEDSGFWPQ